VAQTASAIGRSSASAVRCSKRHRGTFWNRSTRRAQQPLWAALIDREDMSAAAALGPVLDHLIHRTGRQQVAPTSLVTGLGSLPAPERSLPRRGRGAPGASERSVARAAVQVTWASRSRLP
jgi:hypothetical protein